MATKAMGPFCCTIVVMGCTSAPKSPSPSPNVVAECFSSLLNALLRTDLPRVELSRSCLSRHFSSYFSFLRILPNSRALWPQSRHYIKTTGTLHHGLKIEEVDERSLVGGCVQ